MKFWIGIDNFDSKIESLGDCWIWTGYLNEKWYGGFKNNGKVVKAHRFSYELIIGSIPNDLVIDHLCCNPPCVNPWHLEPVTNWENALRGNNIFAIHSKKTHCPQGHEYTEQNTFLQKRKTHISRQCKTCTAIKSREWKRKHKRAS